MYEISLQLFTFQECFKSFQKCIRLLAFIMFAMAKTSLLKSIMNHRKSNKEKRDERNNYHSKKAQYIVI